MAGICMGAAWPMAPVRDVRAWRKPACRLARALAGRPV
jgi:hypothetical protein